MTRGETTVATTAKPARTGSPDADGPSSLRRRLLVPTPVMGRLADGPRQRAVMLVALGVVIAGCAISAVSNGFTVLIIGRALQGVGLGLLPVAMAIARRNLPWEAARQTIATLSVTGAIGA